MGNGQVLKQLLYHLISLLLLISLLIIPRYEGIEVDEEYIAKLNNLVDNQFKISNMVLQNNYYKKLFKTNEEDKDSNYVKSDLEGKID